MLKISPVLDGALSCLHCELEQLNFFLWEDVWLDGFLSLEPRQTQFRPLKRVRLRREELS